MLQTVITMLKVERFLCCFKLETGGAIIGWVTLVLNVGLLLLSVSCIVALSVLPCQDIKNFIYGEKLEIVNFDEYCFIGTGVASVLIKIAALLALACAVIGCLCVIGTKKRKPCHIKPMVILLAACTVHGFLNFLSFSVFGVIFGTVTGCISFYLLICIYSLYADIKEEYKRNINVSLVEIERTVLEDKRESLT